MPDDERLGNMKINICVKETFSVIGKEGSTFDGEGFIQRLRQEANAHFSEVARLAKRDANGNILGIWGAMSDFSRSFLPWEDGFSKGLYLAGVEVMDDALPPKDWVKWTVPSYEYLCVVNEGPDTFPTMLQYLAHNGFSLAGAVHDFTCPMTGTGYMFFPIRRL